jgi:hypothetical protein
MLCPPGDHHEFTRAEYARDIPELQSQPTSDNEEQFVRIRMTMPGELAKYLDDADFVSVVTPYNPRIPVIVNLRQLLADIDNRGSAHPPDIPTP